jgi:hypothetical protein
VISLLLIFVPTGPLLGEAESLLIEDMTWTEVRDAVGAGKTTAIYYAGSIEQNGPGMARGRHLLLRTASRLKLPNGLVMLLFIRLYLSRPQVIGASYDRA